MYTKAEIYNLALGALLLTKTVTDVELDESEEIRVLNVHWSTAFKTAVQAMDLDGVAIMRFPLELIKLHPIPGWKFAYKYPQNCLLLRRVLRERDFGDDYYFWRDRHFKDTPETQVARQVGNFNSTKVIFCNEHCAFLEYVPSDFPLTMLSADAGLAIAYKLAILAAPLISGKGAAALRKELQGLYVMTVASAQQHDRQENATFERPQEMSDFVAARLS